MSWKNHTVLLLHVIALVKINDLVSSFLWIGFSLSVTPSVGRCLDFIVFYLSQLPSGALDICSNTLLVDGCCLISLGFCSFDAL